MWLWLQWRLDKLIVSAYTFLTVANSGNVACHIYEIHTHALCSMENYQPEGGAWEREIENRKRLSRTCKK